MPSNYIMVHNPQLVTLTKDDTLLLKQAEPKGPSAKTTKQEKPAKGGGKGKKK